MLKMREMLSAIQKEYDYPVDTEFTVNLSEDGDYVINLLQCRPLQVFHDTEEAEFPEDVDESKIVFDWIFGCDFGVMRGDFESGFVIRRLFFGKAEVEPPLGKSR